MVIGHLLLGVLLVGGLGGCSSTVVSSQQRAAPAATVLRTYAWSSAPPITLADSEAGYSLVDTRIRRAIEQELGARGYTKTTTNRPDFLVAYQVTMHKTPDVGAVQNPERKDRDPVPLGSTRASLAKQYKQGVLRLTIMDPQARTVLWQGSARTIISLTTTTEQREERIHDAVREMLTSFNP